MMKVLQKKRKGGFTLIELIVVMAIVGILAAIAIPRFTGIRQESIAKAEGATATSIVNAIRVQEAETGTAHAAAAVTATSLLPKYMVLPASPTYTVTAGGGATPYTVTWTTAATGVAATQTYTEGTKFSVTP